VAAVAPRCAVPRGVNWQTEPGRKAFAQGRSRRAVGFGLCLLLACAAHALLAWLGWPRPGEFAVATPSGVNVRVVAPAAAPAMLPSGTTPEPRELPAERRPQPPVEPRAAVPAPRTEVAPSDAAPAPRPAADHFYTRGELTRAPAPTAEILLPYPPDVPTQRNWRTVLAVFIDETGRVTRVRIEGPAMPGPFETIAREAFLAAHFTPGELHGQPVPSVIRVEVNFDMGEPGAN